MSFWTNSDKRVLEPGNYTFVIDEANEGISRQNKPCMVMVLRIVSGRDAGEYIEQSLPAFKICALASALGLAKTKGADGKEGYQVDSVDLRGRAFSCDVAPREFNGNTFNDLDHKTFQAKTPTAPTGAADGDCPF